MIQGIFTAWDFSLFESAEETLRHRLERNSTYPFVRCGSADLNKPSNMKLANSDKNFEWMYKATKQWYNLGWFLVFFISFIVLVAVGGSTLFQFMSIFGAIYQLLIFLYNRTPRKYLLDGTRSEYRLYQGNVLAFRGHYHNIYIRLRAAKTGLGDTYFKLTVSGYEVDEQSFTGSTTNCKALRKMGKRIAARLGINYFDVACRSKHHVIRHKCPYQLFCEAGLQLEPNPADSRV